MGALLTVNRHAREGSTGCNVPSVLSLLHTEMSQSLAWGPRLIVQEREAGKFGDNYNKSGSVESTIRKLWSVMGVHGRNTSH